MSDEKKHNQSNYASNKKRRLLYIIILPEPCVTCVLEERAATTGRSKRKSLGQGMHKAEKEEEEGEDPSGAIIYRESNNLNGVQGWQDVQGQGMQRPVRG